MTGRRTNNSFSAAFTPEAVLVLCFLFVATPKTAIAHKGEKHDLSVSSEKKLSAPDGEWIKIINEDYVGTVKPIFQKSCFDCHSQSPRLPWYYSIPLIHGMLNQDMHEAKQHLDMTNDFPFGGHGRPDEDLKAIRDSIVDKSMPPLSYRLMHREANLSESDRQAIMDWIARSEKIAPKNQK